MAPSPTVQSREVARRSDDRVAADARRTLEDRAGQQHGLRTDGDVDVDVRVARVDDAHPRTHQLVDVASTQHGGGRSELHPVVHAGDLGGGSGDRAGTRAGAGERRDDVGEVALALRVVAAERCDERLHDRTVEHVHACVDLGDPTLRRVGVTVLDDADDRPVRVTQDTPVTVRLVEHGREHPQWQLHIEGEQRRERLRSQQRRVAGEHEHAGDVIRERLQRDVERVTGPALLRLDDGGDGSLHPCVPRGDLGLDVRAVGRHDDEHTFETQRRERTQDVPEQRASGGRMEDLRGRRAEAGPPARCEYDGGRARMVGELLGHRGLLRTDGSGWVSAWLADWMGVAGWGAGVRTLDSDSKGRRVADYTTPHRGHG